MQRDIEADRVRLRAIHAAATSGNIAHAGEMATAALAEGLEHPIILSLAAGQLEEAGRPEAALPLLARACELAPQAPGMTNAYGLCLHRLDRHDEAIAAFDAALAAAPDFSPAYANRGNALLDSARLVAAGEDFAAALKLDPANLVALNGLAVLAVRRGDAEEGAALARRVLEQAPDFAPALTTLAEAEIRLDAPEAALAHLAPVAANARLSPSERAMATTFQGDALDRLGRFDEAFARYEAAGQILRASLTDSSGGAQSYVRRLAADVTSARRDTLSRVSSPARSHVFLIGFPRSGTTLLEQVLEQHPDTVTMAEQECLSDHVETALGDSARFKRFLSLPSAELEPMRSRYWEQVDALGLDPAGKVFVDKHPFHSFKLPMITHLFPDAIILLAQRDPRDTVFGCFRRRFKLSGPTREFLALESTAGLYDAAMGLIEATIDAFDPPRVRCRLEDMIADFEGAARDVCDGLGLDWNEGLADFATASKARGVATPSGAQIAGGISSEGVGKWRDYAGRLASVLPKLEAWVVRYGYRP